MCHVEKVGSLFPFTFGLGSFVEQLSCPLALRLFLSVFELRDALGSGYIAS
jgi:hypothetical protein